MKITTIIIAAFSTAALASESQFQFSHTCATCRHMTIALRSHSTSHARTGAKSGCAEKAKWANGVITGVARRIGWTVKEVMLDIVRTTETRCDHLDGVGGNRNGAQYFQNALR
ncbi:hypothetical protein BKA58DRAFT_402525 [Alternaria rosae]|uniref:uncharacterized protein n=1 Tax=Alternaria rosae TaxID=1187941 RepID=UPI001E8E93E0|nr:uncharacterized protein BKA58DRAFT_402525 [Alternaria rosae]KAH6868122.1 hypothetical protein BKA58DRAFT_402525 [Alternaria rosae]